MAKLHNINIYQLVSFQENGESTLSVKAQKSRPIPLEQNDLQIKEQSIFI